MNEMSCLKRADGQAAASDPVAAELKSSVVCPQTISGCQLCLLAVFRNRAVWGRSGVN